jgi:fructose-specific phosphotransferase system IIC component
MDYIGMGIRRSAVEENKVMENIWLFLLMWIVGGLGAAVGSMVGHAFGSRGLFIGGIVGGLLAVALVSQFAAWRGWISKSQRGMTTLGGTLGFLLAATIATRTLSSPIGPILSSLLIGLGAVLGARVGARGSS